MKKPVKPETIQTATEPLSQEVIDWYISTLGATPTEKVDELLELLDAPITQDGEAPTTLPQKQTR